MSTGGQVFIDRGAEINLAGTTDAMASVLQNIIELELRGYEEDLPTLRPAPRPAAPLMAAYAAASSASGPWSGC